MKHLFIIFSLLLTSISWTKDSNCVRELVIRNGLYYETFSDTPFTGTCIGHHQGKLKKGKKIGKWVTFNGTGTLKMSEENYDKKGRKHGAFLRWNFDGVKERHDNYKHGRKHGDQYFAMHHVGEETFSQYKNGRRHGYFKQYKYGRLVFHYVYKKGKLKKTVYSRED